jgi:hypothetical protein
VRIVAIAVAAAFWFAAGAPALAHHAKAAEHQELAQAKKKNMKKNMKAKKSGKPAKKEQYMKAAPSK